MSKTEDTQDSLSKLDVLRQVTVKLAAKTTYAGSDLPVLVYVATKWNGERHFGQSCVFSVPDATVRMKLSALPTGYIPIETNSMENGGKSNRVLWLIFIDAADPSGLTYGDIFHAFDEWNTRHCYLLGNRILLERVTVSGLEVRVRLGTCL